MILLSFVIPVYNAEKYLSRCIESILAIQSNEIEIIAVNDGSSDQSLSILKKYPITVIDQSNAGVSAARNRGIATSKGRYITFVDADDSIDSDAYLSLLSSLKGNEQAFMMGYRIYDENRMKEVLPPFDEGHYGMDDIRFLKRCLTDVSISKNHHAKYLGGKVYQYIVKRELFEHISFPEGLPYAEDLCYCMQLFTNIDSLSVVHLVTYNYYVNAQSAMHSTREFFWEEYKQLFERIFPYIESEITRNRLVYWAGLGVINSYISSGQFENKISNVIVDALFQKAVHHLDFDDWTFREQIEYKLLSTQKIRLWMFYKRLIKLLKK